MVLGSDFNIFLFIILFFPSFYHSISTGVSIKLDYGFVGNDLLNRDSTVEAESKSFESMKAPSRQNVFYTRQILFSVLLTVHIPLEARNLDILYYPSTGEAISPITPNPISSQLPELTRNLSIEELMVTGLEINEDDREKVFEKSRLANEYCLVTFDLTNHWLHPFEMHFLIRDGQEITSKLHESMTIIHSGCTKR